MKPRSVGPTVVLDFGDHSLVSRGDAAMLISAIDRIRGQWPDACIGVVSSSRARLRLLDPSVSYLAQADPANWRVSRSVGDEFAPPRWLLELWWSVTQRLAIGHRLERLRHRIARRAGFATTNGRPRYGALDRATLRPDLTLATGGGYFCDMDADRASGVLDTLAWAKRAGSVTALVSQGIGPVTDDHLRRRMAEVLPTMDKVVTRERLRGPAILREVGVADKKIRVAGDDAMVLATRVWAPLHLRRRIGVSLRTARYLQLEGDDHRWLTAAIAAAAATLHAPVRPVTNCEWGDEDRAPNRALAKVVPDLEPDIRRSASPQAFADALGMCRVVVTTTYHPALFALAQGVPAVCVCRSDYQLSKFAGLSDLFGGEGIVIIDPTDPAQRDSIGRQILSAWQDAETLEPSLRAKAKVIRDRILAVYDDLGDRVDAARTARETAADWKSVAHMALRDVEHQM